MATLLENGLSIKNKGIKLLALYPWKQCLLKRDTNTFSKKNQER